MIEILNIVSKENGFTIVEINTALDHIHILIECSPQNYIPNIIKALKGISSRLLMKEFKTDLKRKLWGGSMWSPSYFVATVSENAEKQIKEYIKNQKKGR